jgi:hypothetical protein
VSVPSPPHAPDPPRGRPLLWPRPGLHLRPRRPAPRAAPTTAPPPPPFHPPPRASSSLFSTPAGKRRRPDDRHVGVRR